MQMYFQNVVRFQIYWKSKYSNKLSICNLKKCQMNLLSYQVYLFICLFTESWMLEVGSPLAQYHVQIIFAYLQE